MNDELSEDIEAIEWAEHASAFLVSMNAEDTCIAGAEELWKLAIAGSAPDQTHRARGMLRE